MRSAGKGSSTAQAQQVADALDRRVSIALRVLGEQFVRDLLAVGSNRDDVCKGAAAVDPELPPLGLSNATVGSPRSG